MDRNRLRQILLIVLVLGSLAYAFSLRWVTEDAYISFRYARNWVEGHGLVFNPGERVEGYTNFLWTALLAGGLRAGFSPLAISTSLGLLFSAVTLMLIGRFDSGVDQAAVFPAALAALGFQYTWGCFSTSGLETSLLTCLLVCGFFVLRTFRPATVVLSALFFALSLLTRPDAALAPLVVGIYLLFRDRRLLLLFFLPFIVIYLPYFLWRYHYYGYLLPNTFYVKVSGTGYVRQGLVYVWEFCRRYSLWLTVPLFGALWFRNVRSELARRLPLALAGVYTALHVAYVVWIGGDFMEGRFLVPILPFFYLLCEFLIRAVVERPQLRGVLLALLVLVSVADRPQIEPRRVQDNISDERTWAPVFRLWYLEGEVLGKHLPAGTLIATDAVGAFGYASNLPILDTLGLTDAVVAHEGIEARGRPGHEKSASPEYLKRRNVAILRDGMGLYQTGRQADWILSNNHYYLLSTDPEIRTRFTQAVKEIEDTIRR